MKAIKIIILTLFSIASVMAQDSGKFGVEIRTSSNITYNNHTIYGGGFGYNYYTIDSQKNFTSMSNSLGLIYSINKNSLLKLHLGRHQNGRIFDLTYYSDDFTIIEYLDNKAPYYYLQLTPSYVYNLTLGKGKIPLEAGISINKHIKQAEVFFMSIKQYNYDLRLAVGYEYPISSKLSAGVNAVYARALSPYQNGASVMGKYSPLQLGLEVNVKYSF